MDRRYSSPVKTTLDLPDKELKQVLKNTGAKSKGEAVLIAVKEFNRRKRLAAVAARLKGSLPAFMSPEELKWAREDGPREAVK